MEKKNPEERHGKQNNQKMKPYLVMQYLLKYTDENNPITGEDLAAVLMEDYGINAERRSIYRDIEEINKAIIMLEQDCDIETAEEILAEDGYNEEKLILKNKRGFYAKRRNYDVNDIRLLAECIYSAKFLEKSQSNFLIDVICELVNELESSVPKSSIINKSASKTFL